MLVLPVYPPCQLPPKYSWCQKGPCGSGWVSLYQSSVTPRAGHAPCWHGNVKAPPWTWLPEWQMMPMSYRWTMSAGKKNNTVVYFPKYQLEWNSCHPFFSGLQSIQMTLEFIYVRLKTVRGWPRSKLRSLLKGVVEHHWRQWTPGKWQWWRDIPSQWCARPVVRC